MATSATDTCLDISNELRLESGILSNVKTFSAVFERIFLKFDRTFEDDENGGKIINFGGNSFEEHVDSLEDKLADAASAPVRFEEDVTFNGEDIADPELAAKLHERVVRIKKEINWSDDEEILENTHLPMESCQEDIGTSSADSDLDSESENNTSLSLMSPTYEVKVQQKVLHSDLLRSPSQTDTANKIFKKRRLHLPKLNSRPLSRTVSELNPIVPHLTSPPSSSLFYDQRNSHLPLECSSHLLNWCQMESNTSSSSSVCAVQSERNVCPFTTTPFYTFLSCCDCSEQPLITRPCPLYQQCDCCRPEIDCCCLECAPSNVNTHHSSSPFEENGEKLPNEECDIDV